MLHSVSSGNVPLPIGSYIVVAAADGYNAAHKQVQVDPWVETPVEFNLRPVQLSLSSPDETGSRSCFLTPIFNEVTKGFLDRYQCMATR